MATDGWDIHIKVDRGYKPLPEQLRFHQSDAEWRLLAGGFGGGKTKPASREAIRIALEYPRSFGLVMRRKATDLVRSTWRTFRRELAETGLLDSGLVSVIGGNAPNSPPVVRFAESIGGSEIHFVHGENEEPLYGVEPDWVFVDEGGEVSDAIYLTLVGRLRGTANPNGKVLTPSGSRVSGPLRIWIATNPGPSGFIRKNFRPPGINGKPTPGFETFSVPTLRNPHLPTSVVDRMLEQYHGPRKDAMIMGNWGAFEGQVFTMFDWDTHVIEDIEGGSLKGKLLVEGYDFGREVETAVVWIAIDEEGDEPIVVFHDYGAENREVRQHATKIRQVRLRYGIRTHRHTQGMHVQCLGDPAGGGLGKTWGSAAFYEEGIDIGTAGMMKSDGIRDAFLGNLLARRHPKRPDEPRIVFCRRTTGEGGVVDQLLQAHYVGYRESPDQGPRDRRAKKDDHRLDALEYALQAALPYYSDVELPSKRGPKWDEDIGVSLEVAMARRWG